MKIEKLSVKNFRNLRETALSFSSGINCIFGNNGNGKTNVLEAIYYIANRKSFRKNTSFAEFLSIDGEDPEVIFSSVFHKDDEVIPYSGKVTKDSADWYFQGKPAKRKKNIPVVFINPFDSFNFHNSPSARRNWIDTQLSLIDSEYKATLKKFQSQLKFINALLSKKPSKYMEQIKPLIPGIAASTWELVMKRQQFLMALNEFCCDIFNEIFSEEHNLAVTIDSQFCGKTIQQIEKIFFDSLPKSDIIGHLTYGPHKDDYVLLFDGMNSYDFCSLGQQKMSYLSLLFAYIKLFRYKFKTFPIVLMDDVSGELDESRWKNLIGYLRESEFQIFITTANKRFREELEKIEKARKIFVSNGEFQYLQ